MKFRYATLAAGAVAMAFSTAAFAAPSATFTLQYVGSANADLVDSVNVIDNLTPGAGVLANGTNDGVAQLQVVDYNNPAFETASWRHYFRVLVSFTPDAGNTTERFSKAIISINLAGNIHAVSADQTNGLQDLYYPYAGISNTASVGEFSQNNDAGIPYDLQDITVLQTSASIATTTRVGLGSNGAPANNIKIDGTLTPQPNPSPLGVFGISFNSPGGGLGTLSVGPGLGQNFAYFTANSNTAVVTTNTGITGSSIQIGTAAVPEPASLGVLALGGLALLARRRKA